MAIPEFTPHQIDLLLGKVGATNAEEDAFIQDHANDVIPGYQEVSRPAGPPPPPGIDDLLPPGVSALSSVRPQFVPPTFVAKTAEGMEKKEK